MFIEKNDTSLIIWAETDELLSSHKLQLRHLGFVKHDNAHNSYFFNGPELGRLTLQVIHYFEKKGVIFELSPGAKKVLQDEIDSKNRFSDLRQKACDYKNGNFNIQDFSEFCRNADSLPRRFKQHQYKAAFHHIMLMNSADFSVPGSGKTASSLLTYEVLRKKGDVNSLFVVGPPSCFTAWKREFEVTLGRSPNLKILTGIPKEIRISNYYDFFEEIELYLISFQSFVNDSEHIKKFFSHQAKKVFFIVDEAHYIKQLDGSWAQSILDVSTAASCKQVLTGTPCPHSYSDLFNMFDLLWGKDKIISDFEKQKIVGLEKNKEYKAAGAIIQSCIGPFFYRVRKKDLGLTAPVFHPPLIVDMNNYEREIYSAVHRRITHLSKFDGDKNIHNLLSLKRGRIIRLRQLTSYSKLLSNAIEEYDEDLGEKDLGNLILNYDAFEVPGKIEALLQLILQIRKENQKIVVWSNFIETINLIEQKINLLGITCDHIYGSVPIIDDPNSVTQSRERIIDKFLTLDNELDILVANPAACAESISLHTSCHNAIYYDLSYNCGQYLQSLDRIHRVGGSEHVEAHYYHIMYRDTIDQDIFSNLDLKREKMENVIEIDSDIYNLDTDIFDDNDNDLNAYKRLFSK